MDIHVHVTVWLPYVALTPIPIVPVIIPVPLPVSIPVLIPLQRGPVFTPLQVLQPHGRQYLPEASYHQHFNQPMNETVYFPNNNLQFAENHLEGRDFVEGPVSSEKTASDEVPPLDQTSPTDEATSSTSPPASNEISPDQLPPPVQIFHQQGGYSRYSFARRRSSNHCSFCFQNGEEYKIYSTHDLKTDAGIILCPVLRNYICPICEATGDNAHTVKYCPMKYH